MEFHHASNANRSKIHPNETSKAKEAA